MRRRRTKDPVTAEVRLAVLRRDKYRCVAPELALIAGLIIPGPCRTVFGSTDVRPADLQIDHVREHPGGMRRSVERWLQSVCPFHHGTTDATGWITSHEARAAARVRLADLYPEPANA